MQINFTLDIIGILSYTWILVLTILTKGNYMDTEQEKENKSEAFAKQAEQNEQQPTQPEQNQEPLNHQPNQEWIDSVPDKFKKDGVVQYDNLLKSYNELQKQFHNRDIDPEIDMEKGYDINMENLNINRNNDLEQTLMENGFSQKQTQLIYELANQYMGDELNEISQTKLQLMEGELSNHFGGDEKWQSVKEDIAKWGQANLNPETFAELARDTKGIKNIYTMMNSAREFPLSDNNNAPVISRESLSQMMDDPKYWRDKDPAHIAKVEQGFKDLYGDEKVKL